tara:strand:- start:149 stop:616 length:468 start_codon:yes stop_codon:yes gene_type:complete
MDGSQRSIEEYLIPTELVEKFLITLQNMKQQNISVECNTCTKNGFQTPNILLYERPKKLSELLMKEIRKNLNLFHMHLIEYDKNGEQLPHDHKKTEDYSFILYLNDSDGNTVFENIGEIEPKKGKLVFFESHLLHYARPSVRNKKVAVGALKIID